jgi:hypothetical protein
MLGETKFLGSELHTCIKNHNIKNPDGLEKIKHHLSQSRIAMKEQPLSAFWKDAVNFMELKMGALC